MGRRKTENDAIALLLRAIFALVASALRWLSGRGGQPPAAARAKGPAPKSVVSEQARYREDFRWPDLGDFDFPVVGESFSQPQIAAIAATGVDDFDVALVPYRSEHDHLAVAMVRPNGDVLGHLSRPDARSYRRRLAAMKRGGQVGVCRACIIGGHELRNGEIASRGVMLDLKPLD